MRKGCDLGLTASIRPRCRCWATLVTLPKSRQLTLHAVGMGAERRRNSARRPPHLDGTLRAHASFMNVSPLATRPRDRSFARTEETREPPGDFSAFVAQRRKISREDAEEVVQSWLSHYCPRSTGPINLGASEPRALAGRLKRTDA
jgi:hypothetical protein